MSYKYKWQVSNVVLTQYDVQCINDNNEAYSKYQCFDGYFAKTVHLCNDKIKDMLKERTLFLFDKRALTCYVEHKRAHCGIRKFWESKAQALSTIIVLGNLNT